MKILVGWSRAALLLVVAALAVPMPDRAAAASRVAPCPWLHSAAIHQLVPKEGYVEEVFTDVEACSIRSGKASLSIVIGDAEDAELLDEVAGGDCGKTPLEGLGPHASVSEGCRDIAGSLVAVRAIVGDKFAEYTFQPGRDPTRAERDVLIRIVKDSQAAAARPAH